VVGVGINGLECGVVAVMHCLRCSAFGLARLLSQLNHAETPNGYTSKVQVLPRRVFRRD